MKKSYLIVLALVAVLLVAFVLIMVMTPTPSAENEIPSQPDKTVTEPAETEPEETEPPAPPANTYYPTDFAFNEEGFMTCSSAPYLIGIDISEMQEDIDWNQLRESGIQFVMIRAGFRGYGESGKLVADAEFYNNLRSAHNVGMQVGLYFFSQAISVEEAEEEANFLLDLIGDLHIDMPIAYDWEYIGDYARTADTDKETVTACTKAFCHVISDAGYSPMFYSNQNMSDSHFDLVELQDYPMWLAMYDMPMIYPHRLYMWQYTSNAEIAGVSGPVDLNIYLPQQREIDDGYLPD